MKTLFTTTLISLLSLTVFAQQADKKSVVIGSMTTKPNALLIVNPPNADQGVLLPQISTGQRMSMKPSSPSENGLIVFDTNLQTYYYWSDGVWVRMDANNYKKSNYYTIDPVDFQGLKPNGIISQNNVVIFENDNTFVTPARDGMGEVILAAVGLPNGALLKELTVYYMDNDVGNLKVQFMRKSLSGPNENILTWESAGTAASVRSETFNNFNGMDAIDLQNYTYRLMIIFDISAGDLIDQPILAKQRIYGVKIKYQP